MNDLIKRNRVNISPEIIRACMNWPHLINITPGVAKSRIGETTHAKNELLLKASATLAMDMQLLAAEMENVAKEFQTTGREIEYLNGFFKTKPPRLIPELKVEFGFRNIWPRGKTTIEITFKIK